MTEMNKQHLFWFRALIVKEIRSHLHNFHISSQIVEYTVNTNTQNLLYLPKLLSSHAHILAKPSLLVC